MSTTELVTVEQVEDVLLHGGELAVVAPDDVASDIVARILGAEDLAQAFGGFTATPAKELEGQLIEVRGVAWMRSAFEEGPRVYALLDVLHLESGEVLTVSMGGRTLMASFLWAQRHQAMPIRGTFRQQRSNSNTEHSFWTFNLA